MGDNLITCSFLTIYHSLIGAKSKLTCQSRNIAAEISPVCIRSKLFFRSVLYTCESVLFALIFHNQASPNTNTATGQWVLKCHWHMKQRCSQAFLLYICMSTQIPYNFCLSLTEEWGIKLQQNKVPRKTFELIRFDKLEKVNNLIILYTWRSFVAGQICTLFTCKRYYVQWLTDGVICNDLEVYILSPTTRTQYWTHQRCWPYGLDIYILSRVGDQVCDT